MLTAMLSRPGFAVAGMALASAMIAAVAGAFVFVILPQTDDWDFAELPPVASREPSLPEAPALPSESGAGVTGGEAGHQAQPASQQPALPSQPAAQPENQPAEKPMEVAALDLPPDLPARQDAPVTMAPNPAPPARPEQPVIETPAMTAPESAQPANPVPPVAAAEPEPDRPERAVVLAQGLMPAAPAAREPAPPVPAPPMLEPPVLAPPLVEPPAPAPPARSEPPAAPSPFASQQAFATAAPAPVPSARPEPPTELLTFNRTLRHAGRATTPYRDRAGFQFADSDVRYLTGAELQRLSVDHLRIARNEIFARKGRLFRDPWLRTYFEQFPWYQPHVWDVALSPVEVANVGLIQSVEDAVAAHTRSIGGSVPVETEPGTRVAFLDPHRRYLTPVELQGLSTDQLVLVRNEIFARKGRFFRDPSLRSYFEQFPWYQPYAWDVALSPVERANVDMIQSVQQSRTGRAPPM